MTGTTTIQISDARKGELDDLKQVDGETYDSVVSRLLHAYKDEQPNTPAALSYEDVVAASEQGARQALDDYQA